MGRFTLLFLSLVLRIAVAQPSNPAGLLRIEVLRAVLPGAEISRIVIPTSSDTLAASPYYRVHSQTKNQAEDCACQDIITGKRSQDRELRLRVFPSAGGFLRCCNMSLSVPAPPDRAGR